MVAKWGGLPSAHTQCRAHSSWLQTARGPDTMLLESLATGAPSHATAALPKHDAHVPCLTVCCRHPASGYVQGMNDLATPFVAVFLSELLPGQINTWTADSLTEVGWQMIGCGPGVKFLKGLIYGT